MSSAIHCAMYRYSYLLTYLLTYLHTVFTHFAILNS